MDFPSLYVNVDMINYLPAKKSGSPKTFLGGLLIDYLMACFSVTNSNERIFLRNLLPCS